MKKLSLILFSLFYSFLIAQNPSEDYLGSWYTYGSNHRLGETYSVSPYGEFRFYEPSSNYNLAFFSIRVNYHLNTHQVLGLGYAYLDIDTVFEFDKEPNVKEHRLFEQYTFKKKFTKCNITHRLRLEQRFLDFRNRNEIQHRFRYRVSLKYKLNQTFSLVVSDEPFVNFQNQVFHENRFYSGIQFSIVKHTQLQIGYLKQHIRKSNLNRIQIGITLKTDHRKTESTV